MSAAQDARNRLAEQLPDVRRGDDPVTAHRVEWRFDRDGAYCHISCDAGLGATCHQVCTRPECEEGCACDEPRTMTTKYCGYIEWITNGGYVHEYYDGPDTTVRDGPVTIRWDGDTYVWKYGEATP